MLSILLTIGLLAPAESPMNSPKELRAGIIGLDTSHAIAFTKLLNAEGKPPALHGVRVVAAYPQGSPDIQSSVRRVPAYTKQIQEMGVEIVDSIPELLDRVDVVLLETNDGRPHLEQALPVFRAGKPVFIDKPLAASLTDVVALYQAADRFETPMFTSSALRFGRGTQAARAGKIGAIQSCQTSSPCKAEPTHPRLYWYGIHGVESLFTVMGTGCQSVRRQDEQGLVVVQGVWKGASGPRTGTYREGKGYAGEAVGSEGKMAVGSYDGYQPLVESIVAFFKTGNPPVERTETLELYAFMSAADISEAKEGAEVAIAPLLEAAEQDAQRRLDTLLKKD